MHKLSRRAVLVVGCFGWMASASALLARTQATPHQTSSPKPKATPTPKAKPMLIPEAQRITFIKFYADW